MSRVDPTTIQTSLRAGIQPRAVRLGPFLVLFDPHTDSPFRNYAIPDDAAEPTPEDVDRLIAAFLERHRTPRLEYVGRPPAVERVLSAAGFTADRRLPLMTAEAADLVAPPAPSGIELRLVDSDAELWRAAAVQNAAYGEGEPAEPDVDRLRRNVAAGGGVGLAVLADAGAAVGSGVYTPPEHGLVEVASMGVLPEHRRRGIATALAHRLTVGALGTGAVPFLQADGEPEQRMYARIGYRTVGELTLSTRAGPGPPTGGP
jgi:GNAT superfamily N-acetyltransferase